MSGIFKGDSIYKSGGDGGGFKNGGELVDGDFIKVENNTVSSYDNVSRDPVNFYFEVKDGEILNSVVELTTEVNATINVYILKNGFYYILGNVGGNTVNAGDDYKVNITGDSFSVEEVTGVNSDPVIAEINGKLYSLVRIGGQLYTREDYDAPFIYNFGSLSVGSSIIPPDQPGRCVVYKYGVNYGNMYRLHPYKTVNAYDGYNTYKEQFENSVAPFRLPKSGDSIFDVVSSTLRTTLSLNNAYVNNASNGTSIYFNSLNLETQFAYAAVNDSGNLVMFYDYDVNRTPYLLGISDCFMRIRLCIDA